ncbi:MAG: hypothetical protein ACRD0M_12985, partial [Acidimicrobiales bacterium]
VVGVAQGVKWTNGEPTGKPAVLVLVTHKVPADELAQSELVPKSLKDTPTDVLAIGQPMAGPAGTLELTLPTSTNGASSHPTVISDGITSQLLAKRVRPAEGGYSVGHFRITAGTIATCAYNILPGGSTSPPSIGVGIPPRYFILSNNHVLANSNAAAIGDPILQPGPADGGLAPADVIAKLSAFIPITFNPPVPLANHNNLVDAAVAEVAFHDADREIHWIGNVRGWRRKAGVVVGTVVQKTGRTTNYTLGRITAINATVDVGYGGGRTARFKDQILTTAMSAGGDSGSLVTTVDEVAVGLLFAGSASVTVLNQIENVRNLLKVEVAEQIL